MLAIIDYGMGNLRSVSKAFESVGHPAVVTRDAAQNAERLRVDRSRDVVLPSRLTRRRQRQFQTRQVFRNVAARNHPALAFPIPAEIRMSVLQARRRLWRSRRLRRRHFLRENRQAQQREQGQRTAGGRVKGVHAVLFYS